MTAVTPKFYDAWLKVYDRGMAPKSLEFSARTYSIACPSGCGGKVTAAFVQDESLREKLAEIEGGGALHPEELVLDFRHSDPSCDAFEEGDVLVTLVEAFREGKFETTEKEN